MLEKKDWNEFRDAGMLWVANTFLQFFGWSIVIEIDEGVVTDVYTARSKYRGFGDKEIEEGHKKVVSFVRDHIDELYEEAHQ